MASVMGGLSLANAKLGEPHLLSLLKESTALNVTE